MTFCLWGFKILFVNSGGRDIKASLLAYNGISANEIHDRTIIQFFINAFKILIDKSLMYTNIPDDENKHSTYLSSKEKFIESISDLYVPPPPIQPFESQSPQYSPSSPGYPPPPESDLGIYDHYNDDNNYIFLNPINKRLHYNHNNYNKNYYNDYHDL